MIILEVPKYLHILRSYVYVPNEGKARFGNCTRNLNREHVSVLLPSMTTSHNQLTCMKASDWLLICRSFQRKKNNWSRWYFYALSEDALDLEIVLVISTGNTFLCCCPP
jgi:hypothetical protein